MKAFESVLASLMTVIITAVGLILLILKLLNIFSVWGVVLGILVVLFGIVTIFINLALINTDNEYLLRGFLNASQFCYVISFFVTLVYIMNGE